MTYVADDEAWPLCVDTMSGHATDAEVERYNARRAQRLAREGPHVQIVDARGAERMNADQRRRIADFNRDHRDAQAAWVAGVAFISDSTVIRGVLQAIYWLHPPPYPTAVFDELDAAMRWARARLAERG
ncbi:MAG: hypothetical protein KC619_25450 [Myxococcales bacterium]|nr:hypothetical protein [Myxococcales bacterium]